MKRSEQSASVDMPNEVAICDADDTTCSVCYAEFLDPEDLEVHIQQVHPYGTLISCQFCPKCFPDAECYVLHIRDVHLLNLKSCFACLRVFADYTQLRRHEVAHPRSMREGMFPCSQCKDCFRYKPELHQHEVENHHDSDDGVFLNKYFSLFASVINIKAETFIQSIANDIDSEIMFTYICTCCKFKNTNLEEYIWHLKKNNCRSQVCDRCCKAYIKKGILAAHVTKYPHCNIKKEVLSSPSKRKSRQCPKCKEHYEKYIRHKCKPSLKCSDCNTDFNTMYELSDHLSREHPLVVALKVCKFCRKECVGTVSLEKHIQRAHSHEFHLYKYTCTYCNTTFKHPQQLFYHYLRKHKDIQPYLCKICDKNFRVRKAFTLHIKLEHKSEGFVEFDEKLHVFFAAQKSKKPFQPVSIYAQEESMVADKNDAKNRNKDGTNEKSQDLDLMNIDSDANPTETEDNQSNNAKETTGRKNNHDSDANPTEIEDNPTNNAKQTTGRKRNHDSDSNPTETEDNQTNTAKETTGRKHNHDSDGNPTETRDNKTNNEKETTGRKRKRVNTDEAMALTDCDSDDEPLLVIKKKAKLKSKLRKRPLQWKKTKKISKMQFTCQICKKYCYTFQNYQNHVNMHFKDEAKRCIKCSLSFKSKSDLESHMADQHSSSRLTETLKNILERRKKGEQKKEISVTDKFLNTIKKVEIQKDNVTATVKPITKDLSVQKFIESFTPEGVEAKNMQIKNSINITKVTNPIQKKPVIKMTKFKPAPQINESHIKLAMPVRFKKCNEIHSISIRKVPTAVQSKVNIIYDDGNQFQEDDNNDYNYEEAVKDNNIPEVEQEVTLEGTEDVAKRTPATHKIVIPKLPKELKSIRIAHLLPEAPYYKIVKVSDIIKAHEEQPESANESDNTSSEEVRLPDGTKLVHVNPLAHLLGDTPVEQIIKPNKYKPKARNYESALAKALRKLDSPWKQARKKTGQKKETAPENKSENVKEVDNVEKEAVVSEKELAEDVCGEEKISDSVEN